MHLDQHVPNQQQQFQRNGKLCTGHADRPVQIVPAVRINLHRLSVTHRLTDAQKLYRGDLAGGSTLDRQIERLVASRKLESGVRAFFSDLLRLDEIDEVLRAAGACTDDGADVCRTGNYAKTEGACDNGIDGSPDCELRHFFPLECQDCTCIPLGPKYGPTDGDLHR